VRSARRRGILNTFDVGGVFAMELVTPSSIAFSGTSASIVGSGSVDFSAVSSLSLNGVFSADYDNYMVSIRYSGTNAGTSVLARLRTSGSDSSTGYTRQYIIANGTSVSAARETSANEARVGVSSSTQRSGSAVHIYGPFLGQPTAFRDVTIYGSSSGTLWDNASTHSVSTSYDGLTIFVLSGDFTGNVAVYGLRG
jgi:hypothetical protein